MNFNKYIKLIYIHTIVLLLLNTNCLAKNIQYKDIINKKNNLLEIINYEKTIPIKSNSKKNWPKGPIIPVPTAVLIDIDSGLILYEKNAHEHFYPASTTKILTALLCCENNKKTDTIKFSKDSLTKYIQSNSSNCNFKIGEKININDALKCMLIVSANEVANQLAETTFGNRNIFIKKMNKKAKQIGCTNSHFTNPCGFYDDNHYVTAHDLALISAYAYKNKWFKKLCGIKHYKRPTTKYTDSYIIDNSHKMLSNSSKYYYKYVTGGKTGYTIKAKHALVTFAEKNGLRLACVILYAENETTYISTKLLFDYGFSNFTKKINKNSSKKSIKKIYIHFIKNYINKRKKDIYYILFITFIILFYKIIITKKRR